MLPMPAFQEEQHRAFEWSGGRRVAVLVHGFPGTPAEMRPLAARLQHAGWAVRGVLLPGFGAQIETLPRRNHREWIGAVREAVSALQADHDQVALIGHSMGGALSVVVAAELAEFGAGPDALVLFAPFWDLDHVLWKLLPALKVLFPSFRLFKLLKVDFSSDEARAGIRNFLPDADLDDPQVQTAIREFQLPVAMFDQIRQIGQLAYRLAPLITTPTLVIQGTQDELVRPDLTRRLIARLKAHARYVELPEQHNLVNPAIRSWSRVEHEVLGFLQHIKD
jgi:carboxylesterase